MIREVTKFLWAEVFDLCRKDTPLRLCGVLSHEILLKVLMACVTENPSRPFDDGRDADTTTVSLPTHVILGQ